MLGFPKSKNTTHPQIKCICKQGTYKNGISSVTLKYKNQYFTAQKIIKEGFFFFFSFTYIGADENEGYREREAESETQVK